MYQRPTVSASTRTLMTCATSSCRNSSRSHGELRVAPLDHATHPIAPGHRGAADQLVHAREFDRDAADRLVGGNELRFDADELRHVLTPLLDARRLAAAP